MEMMEDKIKELRGHYDSLDTVIYILEGRFEASQLDGNMTIKEQIDCFRDLGKDIQEIMDEIIETYGNEQCPSGKD